MKTNLTQSLVLKLSFDEKPVPDEDSIGKVHFVPNLPPKEYILFDSNQNSPVGFGVRVTSSKKSYYVQKRITPDKVTKFKVGNVRDFATIDDARKKAQELVVEALAERSNPNTMARQREIAEITVQGAFERYIYHLENRGTPAKANTLKVVRKAMNALASWADIKIRLLSSDKILHRFDDITSFSGRTTAEQTFRWAIAATKHVITIELHDANSQQRQPLLSHNPFNILMIEKKFRSKAQLEADYQEKGIRNPMSSGAVMQSWLAAVWRRRNKNRTGCDYLLCATLWGTRKNEATVLKWRDRITDQMAASSSWVDLEKRLVFFYDTKNGQNHELPIADAALELLKQRHEITSEVYEPHGIWVFPTASRSSKTRYLALGHYSDMRSLLGYIRNDAGIKKLSMHDIRRTFGRLVDELGLPYSISKRLLNHSVSDVTFRYTNPDWQKLCDHMQRVEDSILSHAPMIYNALKPIHKAPMPDLPPPIAKENTG
jgi:integrase